jgi:NAD(P)H-dependent flavin oxidoreductase YrpB (nitropropane dioxygenase family)
LTHCFADTSPGLNLMSKSLLHTPVCDMFGIEYPIFSAGMGGVVSPSGPELAAAVSEAGGLGVIGGAFVPPEELRLQIQQERNGQAIWTRHVDSIQRHQRKIAKPTRLDDALAIGRSASDATRDAAVAKHGRRGQTSCCECGPWRTCGERRRISPWESD